MNGSTLSTATRCAGIASHTLDLRARQSRANHSLRTSTTLTSAAGTASSSPPAALLPLTPPPFTASHNKAQPEPLGPVVPSSRHFVLANESTSSFDHEAASITSLFPSSPFTSYWWSRQLSFVSQKQKVVHLQTTKVLNHTESVRK